MSTKKVKTHATKISELTVNTLTVSPEVLGSLSDSPHQHDKNRAEFGKMALALELSQDGQANPIMVGICLNGDAPCIIQGHRRRKAHVFGREIGISMPDIRVQVREYASLADQRIARDTLDHGTSVGIQNSWQLYQAVSSLLDIGMTYGQIAYKLLTSFNHCFSREPAKEASVRELEEAAEACALTGKHDAADGLIKKAIKAMGEYRNGAMQTFASLKKLADAGFDPAVDHCQRQWTTGLQTGEKVLSQGPLVALAAKAKEFGVESEEFLTMWKSKTTKGASKDTAKPITKAKLKAIRESESANKLMRAILDSILYGNEERLRAIAADMTVEDVKCSFATAKDIPVK